MEKINCDIIAIVHRFFSDGKRKKGGFDKIINDFSRRGKIVVLIEHPLRALKEGRNENNQVIISFVKNGIIEEIEKTKISKSIDTINWIREFFFNSKFTRKRIEGKPLLMAADPLNGLVGIVYKSRFRKFYYHCIDYSPKRFKGLILNKIYKFLLILNLKKADIVGVVSLRIKNELSKLCNNADKIRYMPNSPVFKEVDLLKKTKHTIVCSGGAIIEKYNYDFLLDLIYKLKKDFDDIKFYAMGGLEEDRSYVGKLKKKIEDLSLRKNVFFVGFLSSQQWEDIMLRSKVGLSFYSRQSSYYTYYGDSLKIREYALYGIPSITDGNSATDNEMIEEEAGLIIKDIDDAKDKIKLLLSDEDVYKKFQKNCILWSSKMDKSKLLKNLYQELFDK